MRQPPKRSGRPPLRGGEVELSVHDYLLKPGQRESVYRMTPSALGRGCRRPGFTFIVGRDTRQNQGQPTLLRQSGRPDLNREPLVPQTSLSRHLARKPPSPPGGSKWSAPGRAEAPCSGGQSCTPGWRSQE
jgi:hypothetical protein